MSRTASLSEVHRSVTVPKGVGLFKRMVSFLGPAYLIGVGYMDPGNWATDLEGGAVFGTKLIWVLLLSNLMALLLQTLAARLGVVSGRDLAQSCRDQYPRFVSICLWILAEIGIAATDLAEVLGTAIGLNLLVGVPLIWGVVITMFDSFLFLAIQHLGMRRFERFILALITVVGISFLFEVILSKPDWGLVASGFVPSLPQGSIYIVLGIIGATVMPHNLYLHSSLVQTRAFEISEQGKRQACWFNFVDSMIALNAAFFVNAAIMIMAAATFFHRGIIVRELQQAHAMLAPLLGTKTAGLAFAIALLCAGQASTLTGTLAGQIVMEGFLHFKIRPFLRRFFTRLLAVGPAVLAIALLGDQASYKLLIFSQVLLSIQLPFAVIPLIHFTSDQGLMGNFASSLWIRVFSWMIATFIVLLNINLAFDTIASWLGSSADRSILYLIVIPFLMGLIALFLYVLLKPILQGKFQQVIPAWKKFGFFLLAGEDNLKLEIPEYRRIGVAVGVSEEDKKLLSHATVFAKKNDATLCILHIVEGVGGRVYGEDTLDAEAREDKDYLDHIAAQLAARGVDVETCLGHGDVPKEILRLVDEQKIDILFMGSHGHRGISAFIFGSTIRPVKKALGVPLVVIK